MAKSSINFKKASGHSSAHNMRIDEPHYLLPKEHRLENESWQSELNDKELFELELKNSKPKGGPKPKLENSRWEAVLNLNKRHTLEDVKKVAEHIAKKFNITPTEITIHRDEGRIENGKPVYNFHAHLNFLTYKDGKQNWRKELIKPAALSELQTDVAKILEMERGKVNSKAKRLDHRQYKAVAQELAYNFREYQKKITALEISSAEKKELHKENTELRKIIKSRNSTIEEQAQRIAELERKLEERKEQKVDTRMLERYREAFNKDQKTLKNQREEANALKAQVSTLKSENVSLRSNMSVLEQEKEELKAEVTKLQAIVDKVSSFFACKTSDLIDRVTSFFAKKSETSSFSFSSPPLERSDIERSAAAPSASEASLEDLLNELENVQATVKPGERIKDLIASLDEIKQLKI